MAQWLRVMGGEIAQTAPRKFVRVIGVPQTLEAGPMVFLSILTAVTILLIIGMSYLKLPQVTRLIVQRFSSTEAQSVYQNVIAPQKNWLLWTVLLTFADGIILVMTRAYGLQVLEFPLGLLVALNIIFLGFTLFNELFDRYLLEIALKDQAKINTELLTLAKFVSNAAIVLVIVFIFATAHQINIFGLTASLGWVVLRSHLPPKKCWSKFYGVLPSISIGLLWWMTMFTCPIGPWDG